MSVRKPKYRRVIFTGALMEIISALTFFDSLDDEPTILIIDLKVSKNRGSVKALAARIAEQEKIEVVCIEDHDTDEVRAKRPWIPGLRKYRYFMQLRTSLDAALAEKSLPSLCELEKSVKSVAINFLNERTRMLVGVLSPAVLLVYPHGLDAPRNQQIQECPFFWREKSFSRLLTTLKKQCRLYGVGEVFLGGIMGLLGRPWTCLPMSGADEVFTFRNDFSESKEPPSFISGLPDRLNWLVAQEPYRSQMDEELAKKEAPCLLILLSYLVDEVWLSNHHFVQSHEYLISEMLRLTGETKIKIKPHVRSDGSDGAYLIEELSELHPEWDIEPLAGSLYEIPVEGLVTTGMFTAVASLASCSIPPGLGLRTKHYVSFKAAKLFDEGWIEDFPVSYYKFSKMLVDEGMAIHVGSHHAEK